MRFLLLVTLALMLPLFVASGQQKGIDTNPPVLPLNDSSLVSKLRESEGRLLLVNVWATWCEPCIEEFPDLLKVRKNYADNGVDVVFISVDDQKRMRRDVQPFLRKMKVTFPTYIKQTKDDEVFMNILSPEWRGALPATFIFDRDGKLVQSYVDATTYAEVSSALQSLLTE